MKYLQVVQQVLLAGYAGMVPLIRAHRLLAWGLGGLLFVPAFGMMAYDLVALGITGPLPRARDLARESVPIASEVYSADSVLLGKYFIENRTPVSYGQLAPCVTAALIATEDRRFYHHRGVDLLSLPRVLVRTVLLRDESAGGGSTLTQQLAKNLFPRQDYGWFSLPVNKLRESVVARRLERALRKDEILVRYLNTVPFGDNTFGIEVACRRFFSCSAREVRPEQAAVLIGMLKATTTYNPRLYPDRARTRRDVVLAQMARQHYLTQPEHDSLVALPLVLKYQPDNHNEGLAPYFREFLRQELERWCKLHPGPDGTYPNLYTDGLKIYTTLDARIQRHAEAAMTVQMKRIQAAFDREWKGRNRIRETGNLLDQAIKASPRYQQLRSLGLPEDSIRQIFNRPVPMQLFTWQGIRLDTLSPADSILHSTFMMQAGLLALDPGTGYVKAWVGGINHRFFQYDHIRSRRQPGSCFKPVIYAAALESGVSPCEYIANEQTTYEGYGNWSPQNADGDYGGEYSLQGALTHSVNIATVNLYQQIGWEQVQRVADTLGLHATLAPNPAVALGTVETSLYDITCVYSAFANGGRRVYPAYLLGIVDERHHLRWQAPAVREMPQAIRPETASLMIHMLSNVVDNGTARGLRTRFGLSSDIAGKTGTTQSQADGWFVGATPGLVAGVWVGANDRRVHFRSMAYGQGASTALPIWGDFFQRIYQDPAFASLRKTRFPVLTDEQRLAMDCDEFWFPYSMDGFKEWWEQQQAAGDTVVVE
ncbi:MAG: transglycosylase domain-containing protein [Bacteroidia bacterium]|nr:transglycosylase domain-containing protein [Bacteroidia bacterium]